MTEQFSLRWNDFYSNLSSGFHALLEGEDLVDVTLAAGGQYIQAHKIILSVCSPYFKQLFKMNPCKHPIVILKDIPHSELCLIIQFMYSGEVNVRQQDLTSFLHTAELLQVKGLTVGTKEVPAPPTATNENESLTSQTLCSAEENSKQDWSNDETVGDNTVCREEDVKSPLKRLLTNSPREKCILNRSARKKNKVLTESAVINDISDYISDNDQLDCDGDTFSMIDMQESGKDFLKQEQGWNGKTGGVKCPSCHRYFANRYNLKVHIRDKHDTMEGTLQCNICQKRMRNPSCLRVHMYHHRKQAAFMASQLIPSSNIKTESTISENSNESIYNDRKQAVFMGSILKNESVILENTQLYPDLAETALMETQIPETNNDKSDPTSGDPSDSLVNSVYTD